MDTGFSQSTARDQKAEPDLNGFAKNVALAVEAPLERDSFLQQASQLLVQQANCGIVFEIELAATGENEPMMRTLATRFSQCPPNVQQWALTTAARAASQRSAFCEDSTSTDSQPVSIVSMPIGRNKCSILAAMFVGSSANESLPFLQIFADQFLRWQMLDQLRLAQRTATDIASLQELSIRVADSRTVEGSCRRLANQLGDHISSLETKDTQQRPTVYVGTINGDQFPTLSSVSDTDSLPEDSCLKESIESAMAESVSRNSESHWPVKEKNFALMCHKKASELLNNDCLASYILPDSEGKARAVVMLQTMNPLSERAKNFLTAAQMQLGIALAVVERGEQNKLQQFTQRMKKYFFKNKTQTIVKVLIAILILGCIPMPYQIKATSEVQPAEKKFLYAPFPAPLKESLVEPGDLVQKGTELARLDNRELSLELDEVQAKLHRAQKQHDGHVAAHEPGEARLTLHESETLQARLEILEQRDQQIVLRSPIEGIVIAGDWKNAAGMPLDTGDTLFEIAPLEKLSIDIFLPDDDVRYAQAGQKVRIKFDSYPFEAFYGHLERIHPAAEIQDDKNVFVATVSMDNPDGKLRPGMKGSAKCSSVWRPIWWNLLHKPAAKCLRYFGW